MRVSVTIICLTVFALTARGQFSYFNDVNGNTGDTDSESMTNAVFLNDTLVTWGGGNIAGQFTELLRMYNTDGLIIDDSPLIFEDAYIYGGITNSFQKFPNENAFLWTQAIVEADGTKGFVMKVDSNLDTIWTKKLDLFPPHTYIYSHTWDGDGFVLAGEFGVAPGEKGTFIAKIDPQGELLWHNIIHQPWEGVYRNRQISAVDSGYYLSGARGTAADTDGRFEILDQEGELQWELVGFDTEIQAGVMYHMNRISGQTIISQGIKYEDYEPSSNPLWAYSKLRLYDLINVDTTPELEILAEYQTDQEWLNGGIFKMLEVGDKIVMSGNFYHPTNPTLNILSFIMQVDGSTYEQDWYTELAYDPCETCNNQLYDLELAPDGGYIMVGKFDSQADPYDKSWLVKVDACGDVEWQGCEPVGISEYEFVDINLEVYPNPTQAIINLDIDEDFNPKIVQLTNTFGEMVLEKEYGQMIDLSRLESGLYVLQITNQEGQRLTKKLIVE